MIKRGYNGCTGFHSLENLRRINSFTDLTIQSHMIIEIAILSLHHQVPKNSKMKNF